MSASIGRNLWDHNQKLNLYTQRMSSGLKINSASDGAANLSLSKKIESNLRATEILKNNASTGLNALTTADGDLDSISAMLQRMRDLSVQGLNGVYSTDEKNMIMAEVDQLAYEIKRISQTSTFSDKKLLTEDPSDPLQIFVTDTGPDNYIDLSSVAKNMLFVDVLAKDSDVYMLNMNPGETHYVEFNNKLYQITNTTGQTKNLIYGYDEDLGDEDNSINFVQDFAGVTKSFVAPYQNDQIQMGNGESYQNLSAGQTVNFSVGNDVFSLTNSDASDQTAVFDTTGTNINMISGQNVSANYQYTLSGYSTATGAETALTLNGSQQKYINFAGKLYSVTNNSASQETFVYRNNAGNLQALSGNTTTNLVGSVTAPTNLNATNKYIKLSAAQELFYSYGGNVFSLKNNTAQAQTLVLDSTNNVINGSASVTRTALSTTNGTIGMATPYSIDAIAGQKYYIKAGDNSQVHELTASATGKLLIDFDGTDINSIGGVGASINTFSGNDFEAVTPDGSNQFVLDLGANRQEAITIGGEVYKISNVGGANNNQSFTYDPVGKTITQDSPIPQITVDGYAGDLTTPNALNASNYYLSSIANGQSTYMQIGADIFKITNSSGSSSDSIMTYNAGAHTLSSGTGGINTSLVTQASFTNNTAADRSTNLNAGQSKLVQFGNDNFIIQNNSANAQNVMFNYSAGNINLDAEIAATLTITKYTADAGQTSLLAGDMYTTLGASAEKYISNGSRYFNIDNTSGARTSVFRRAGNVLNQIAGTGVNSSFLGAETFETLSTASDYYIEMSAGEQQYIKVGTYAYEMNNTSGSTKTDVFRQVGSNLVSQNPTITETNIPISNQSNFGQLLPIVDWALNTVNMKRAEIGSKMAALSQSIEMNTSKGITLSAANSTLIDADIAAVNADFIKTNILKNFSTTLFTQSRNTRKDIVLGLLS